MLSRRKWLRATWGRWPCPYPPQGGVPDTGLGCFCPQGRPEAEFLVVGTSQYKGPEVGPRLVVGRVGDGLGDCSVGNQQASGQSLGPSKLLLSAGVYLRLSWPRAPVSHGAGGLLLWVPVSAPMIALALCSQVLEGQVILCLQGWVLAGRAQTPDDRRLHGVELQSPPCLRLWDGTGSLGFMCVRCWLLGSGSGERAAGAQVGGGAGGRGPGLGPLSLNWGGFREESWSCSTQAWLGHTVFSFMCSWVTWLRPR